MTYDGILSAMKSAFFEKTGRDVDALSDLSVRFECVASELYSLWCRSEFVLKQAIPQLSSGEYLDFHAALFGIERKQSAKALGQLTFYLDTAYESDISVPEGTLCSVSSKPFIQYVTTEEGLILAGDTECTVNAEACEDGARYNTAAGTVSVMVNPPLYVSGVTNAAAFRGGYDEESDRALRDRLSEACSVIPTGFSGESVRQLIMRSDEVLDCNVFSSGESITVMVRTKTDSVSSALTGYIYKCLKLAELLDMEISIRALTPVEISLDVEAVCSAADMSALEDNIKETVEKFATEVKIGAGLNLQKLACVISNIDGVEYADVTSPSATGGIVYAGYGSYLLPSEIGVICHS